MKKIDLIHPIFCWDVYTMYKGDSLPSEVNQQHLDTLTAFRKEHSWQVDLDSILVSSYDALVLTNAQIKIEWVSEDFEKMTGYAPHEAIGKSPKMLQGINTSEASKKRIREKLKENTSFAENLINYRKNGEEYQCRVEIHPIYNRYHQITHYLALETEIL